MKDFEMLLPETLAQAVAALPGTATEPATAERVRMLAGGQDLLPELKEHLAEPDRVVNLKGIDDPALRLLGETDGDAHGLGLSQPSFVVGALRSVADLARHERARALFPVLTEAAEGIASAQVRTLATVGGNLCQRPRCWYFRTEHAVCLKKGGSECFSYAGMNKYNAILGGGPSYIVHPSDLATAFSVHGAAVVTTARTIPIEDFFTLPAEGDPTRENVLAPNEVIRAIAVPLAESAERGWRSTYVKFKERESFDFALAAVALRLRLQEGRIAEARLCLGGVAPVPWRCPSTEALLANRAVDDALVREAGEDALRGAEALDHNGYKIPLTKALVAKALRKLA